MTKSKPLFANVCVKLQMTSISDNNISEIIDMFMQVC